MTPVPANFTPPPPRPADGSPPYELRLADGRVFPFQQIEEACTASRAFGAMGVLGKVVRVVDDALLAHTERLSTRGTGVAAQNAHVHRQPRKTKKQATEQKSP